MTVITISRQLGSLSSEISRMTAEKLGYRLVWREVINQAARLAGAPEVALAEIDEFGILGVEPSPEAERDYLQAVQKVIIDLAEEGNVIILGRAGQIILAGRKNTLHVRLVAPQDIRIARVAARLNIPLEAASAQVRASDRHRKAYLKRGYQIDWNDPDLYDLIINTANLSVETASFLICSTVIDRFQEKSIVQ